MASLHPDSHPRVRPRKLVRGTKQVPWYYYLTFGYKPGTSGFGVWVLQYHPKFKHRMAPALYPKPGDISRNRGPAEVAFHPEKYFHDVVGVQVAVPASRRAQLADLLSLVGYASEDRGAVTVWRGAGFEVVVTTPTDLEHYALRKVRLSLTRSRTGHTLHHLGRSVVLRFEEADEAFLDLGQWM